MNDTTPPPNPIVHLNGSDGKTLAKSYLNAGIKIDEAIKAVAEVGFHQRDYYPGDDLLWDRAWSERQKLLGDLHEAKETMDRIAASLFEQVEERRAS